MRKYWYFTNKRKVFLKLLMNLCFGLFIIVLITGNMINYYFTSTLKEEAYLYNIELLEQTRQIMEKVLQEIEKTAFSLALNRNVQRIAILPWNIEDDYSIVKNVNGLFNERITSTNYIHSIYLYSKESGKIITNMGVIDLKYFQDRTIINNFLYERSYIKWLNTRRIKSYSEPNIDVVTFMIRIPLNPTLSDGVLVINIDQKALYDTVINVNNIKLGEVIIVDQKGTILFSGNKYMLYEKLNYYWGTQKTAGKEKGYFILNMDGYKKFIAYISSHQNNWKYIAITPYEEVFLKSSFVWKITLTICGTCLITGIILALIVSKRYYNPIKELVNAFSKNYMFYNLDQYNKISNKFQDEFSYIKGSVKNLIEQNEKFHQKFIDNEKLLREHFILNLILGREAEIKEIHSKIIYYKIDLEMSNFQVIVLKIYNNDNLGNRWGKGKNVLRYQIRILCEKIISEYTKGVVVDHGSQYFIILLNFEKETDGKKVPEFAKKISFQIREILKKQLNVEVSAGIGRFYNDITDIYLSYKEALEAIKYERIAGRNSIIYINDVLIDQGSRKDIVDFHNIQMEMVNEIKLGRYEKACYFLNQCLNWIFENRRFSFQHKNVMLMELMNSIIKVIVDINGDLAEIFGIDYNFYNELARLNSVSQIKEWFNDLVLNTTKYINKRQNKRNQELIEQVKYYVLSNYTDSITLNDVADTLYISRGHFCRLFKEITGETFVEYITRVRLEKACDLLTRTQDTINDIARATGFGNKQNIIRAFKKYYGMTPTQYRNQYTQELFQK